MRVATLLPKPLHSALLAESRPRAYVVRIELVSPRMRRVTFGRARRGEPNDGVTTAGSDRTDGALIQWSRAENVQDHLVAASLDQTDRLPRPTGLATCEIATYRYRVLHVAARITAGARKVRLRIGRDLAVGHRDLPSMATTSGRPVHTDPRQPGPGQPAHRATPADPSHPPATINTQTGSAPTRHHPRQPRE
jgi:hypothetical protein